MKGSQSCDLSIAFVVEFDSEHSFDSAELGKVQYKQSRAGPMDPRPALPYEERVSQEDSPRQGEQDSGLHSKSLRPCPGRRVEKPRRLSSKASTEAAVSSLMSSAADRTLSDLPFLRCRGERFEVAIAAPHRMPVRLISLPLRETLPSTAGDFRTDRTEIPWP